MREAHGEYEPPYQIIELIGIQGWRLVWRNVRLDVRTRVHLHSCPQTKDDGGMRKFHFIGVKTEKKRIPGAEFGVLDKVMRGRIERCDKCRFGQRVQRVTRRFRLIWTGTPIIGV